MKISKKNQEGYQDLTPYDAIKNIAVRVLRDESAQSEEEKIGAIVREVKNYCAKKGYKVRGRITLQNIESGKVWK